MKETNQILTLWAIRYICKVHYFKILMIACGAGGGGVKQTRKRERTQGHRQHCSDWGGGAVDGGRRGYGG